MHKDFLVFNQSGWWLLVIIPVAAVLTYFLYSKSGTPWKIQQNLFLASIRFTGISLAMLLLLEPFIKQLINRTEKPVIAIAIDNSQSVTARTDDSLAIKSLIETLKIQLSENFDVSLFSFNEDKESMIFSHPTTDISTLLRKVDNYMEGRNLACTILLSDGIFNKGSSPVHRPYMASVFTVGLGDTIPPRDINLSRVRYNRVVFKDNETPIRLEISQKGYDNKEIVISLYENGQAIRNQKIRLINSIQEVEFLVKSKEEGLRRFTVATPVDAKESIKVNNRINIFMEVIDGQQKVLIVASAPHPDIKAIRSALAASSNYRTEVYIPQIHDKVPTDIYDVVIFHGAFNGHLNFQVKENPGIWYILGNESAIGLANRGIPYLSIRQRGSQPDKVTGAFNEGFSKFKLPKNTRIFEEFPPLEVPFGDYNLTGSTEVILYQQLGSVQTRKPLWVFHDDGTQKSATLMGQNIWKWKLQESAVNETSTQFNNLVIKTIQFLSLKNDKKQFSFKSRGSTFTDREAVVFDSEVYNDIYERIYANTLSLRITSAENENIDFEFVDSEINSSFKIPTLKEGIYSYMAITQVGDKTFTDRGEFLIEKVNQEFLNLTADHNLLQVLSSRTGGEYMHLSEASQLPGKLKNRKYTSVIRSTESSYPLRSSPWILLAILVLFSSEWFLRKYWGSY